MTLWGMDRPLTPLLTPISEALQGMLLISQTPDPESRSISPVDPEDRPIEDLSIEELRALAQIARKNTVCPSSLAYLVISLNIATRQPFSLMLSGSRQKQTSSTKIKQSRPKGKVA